jgi:FlaA1/EpsC-like NDP-sugar epimerase
VLEGFLRHWKDWRLVAAADRVLAGIEFLQGRPLTRFGTQMMVDAVAWILAFLLATLFRYDFVVRHVHWASLMIVTVSLIIVQLVVGWFAHLYRGRHPYGSFAEVWALTVATLATGFSIGVVVLVVGQNLGVPRSLVFTALPIAFVIMGAARYVKRLLVERAHRSAPSLRRRTIVYGAGYLGNGIVSRMLLDSQSTYLPVGLIDDNPARRNSWVRGVKVLGTVRDLRRIADETEATVLVIAIANTTSSLLRTISDALGDRELQVKVFPSLEEILEGKSRLRDLRDVSIEDFIGRTPIDFELESVADYLRDKRVLVTGAGGSIGSELCRQIDRFSPAEIIMLDHDETALQATELSIRGDGLLTADTTVLASIRDPDLIRRVFADRRPEIVFHAAALKHLPMLERYPEEAWKSNVIGTYNVLQAALDAGVETFVNISTDKAADPTSVLGVSKRIGERLTAWAAKTGGARYLSVRFGNVIGSRGSMLPAFTAQIEAGGPITVTDPDVTRYFMTIPEACQLVVHAGAIGEPGEVLILDMGEPVRILDVARRMIDMSGRDIEIVFTGLRDGEKLHEELFGHDETGIRRAHPKISQATVAVAEPADVLRRPADLWPYGTPAGTRS